MEKISRFKSGLILIALLVVGCLFLYFFTGKAEIVQKQEKNSAQLMDLENISEKIRTFMPLTGTRWVYEGKRTFYDNESQGVKEVIARKVVEITGIKSEGDNVRATFKETYTNDPDFTEKTGSFLFSNEAFAFDGKTMVKFPLVEGQELTELGGEETDLLYVTSVTKVHRQTVLGTEYPCYDISNSTRGDVSFMTFCEGIGYVRDYYEHNGTPNESDYQLISIARAGESI